MAKQSKRLHMLNPQPDEQCGIEVGLRGQIASSNCVPASTRLIDKYAGLITSIDYNTLLLDACPIGIVIFNSNGYSVAANRSSGKLLWEPINKLETENFRNIKSWRKSRLLNLLEQSINTNRAIDAEVMLHFSINKKRDCIHARLVPFIFNSEWHILTIFSDITEKKNIEEQNRIYAEEIESSLYVDRCSHSNIRRDARP